MTSSPSHRDPEESRSAKSALRLSIRPILKSISPEQRAAASEAICRLLQQQAVWKNAQAILFYAPLKDEIDIAPLLAKAVAQGKRAALPRFDPDTGLYSARQLADPNSQLQQGKFDIPEPSQDAPPIHTNHLDLILVPGLVFDVRGRRLGRGMGFYDRLLKDVPSPKCGIAFDQQLQAEIPAEPHDVNLNFLATPTRWLAFPAPQAVE